MRESFPSDLDAISLHREMAQIPRPAGWAGPFGAKFDDKQNRFSKGDQIYWNKQSGSAGQNMPAYTADDPKAPRPPRYSGVTAPRTSAGVRNTPGGNLETPPAGGIPAGMKLVPKPDGWRGPFAAKFNDNNGRFKKGDMIYWDGQRGGQSVPAFVPEDMDIGDPLSDGGNVDDMVDKIHGVSRPSLEQVRIPTQNMTEFNQEIENRFTQGRDNIMVNALAGTGKTTMLKHLSSFIKPGEKWLYLVFNKKNQLESQNEFPKGVTVMTTHSFLGKLLGGTDKELGGGTRLPPPSWKKETKLSKLADNRQVTPLEWPESSQSSPIEMPVYKINADGKKEKTGQTERIMSSPWHGAARRRAINIASRAKSAALNPNDPDIEQQIAELVERYALDTDVAKPNSKKQPEKDFTEDIIKKAAEFLKLSQPKAADQYMPYASGVRDQDDTLWYAAVHADQINWNMGYNVVLMDEVQDFNNCQIIMAKKLREAGARVIAVGDPNQGMYLFRGADGDAFNKLQETIGAGDSAPLPINFRSGGNILDWVNQNTHVDNMQYPKQNAGQGEVWAKGGTHEPLGYEDFMHKMMGEWDNSSKFDHDTAMIARTNAPLAHAALTFLKNNINFQIVGVDLSKEIIDLIKKVTNGKANDVPLDKFMEDLAQYSEKCQKMWANKISKLDELKEVRAYAGVLQAVYEHLAAQDFRDGENSPQIQTAGALGNWVYARLGGVNENSFDDMKAMEERKKAEPGSFITLTTAHKSKGLEYDRAFLMKPSQFDPESDMVRTEDEAQQERNAWYVAATRAKKVLMVSGDEEPDAQSGNSDDALDASPEDQQNPYMTKKMRMF